MSSEGDVRRIDRLVRVLTDQHRSLVSAQSDPSILGEYAALIHFLRSASAAELQRIFTDVRPRRLAGEETPKQSDEEIANLSRNDVESIINDASTLRKDLERIAIHRFKVPRGSMRSFSNREMLMDKLLSLLHNEQAHTAIEAVAQRQRDPHKESGK